MGWIGKIKKFTRETVNGVKFPKLTVDPGTTNNFTAELFTTAGDDAQPMSDDRVISVENHREGGQSVVGSIDTKNAGITKPGEKRIYSRRENGDVMCEVYLTNDGSIEVTSPVAKIRLDRSGSVRMINDQGEIQLGGSGDISLNGPLNNIEMSADGTITLGKVSIDLFGNIVTPGTYNGQTLPI